jgi:hypothetical protein
MFKKIKDHLDSVDETYFQHMFHAFSYGLKLIAAGLAALLHAICPAIFQTTASRIVAGLNEQLQSRLTRTKA